MPKQPATRKRVVDLDYGSEDEITGTSTTAAQKRKHQEDEGESKKRPKKEFSYLKAQTRRVPQELIASEWKRLPEPAQKQVRGMFLASKRTTLNGIRDPRRRKEAEAVVNSLVNRLEKQLPRMPCPPGSRASHFNLEEVLERNRSFEAEEIPAVDSVKLLEEEIEREELRIEKQRKLLSKLEADAKDNLRKQKKSAKATHPLLESTAISAQYYDDAESIGLVKARAKKPTLDELDEDLAPLLSQFRSHLESIQANGMQLDGVGSAIGSARISLAIAVPPATP